MPKRGLAEAAQVARESGPRGGRGVAKVMPGWAEACMAEAVEAGPRPMLGRGMAEGRRGGAEAKLR